MRNAGWNLASSFGAYRVAKGVGRFYKAMGYAHKYERSVRIGGRTARRATGYGAINNLGIGTVSYAAQANMQARYNRWAHKWD